MLIPLFGADLRAQRTLSESQQKLGVANCKHREICETSVEASASGL
jgi:hypothetical protein